jgi:hypothetical protein
MYHIKAAYWQRQHLCGPSGISSLAGCDIFSAQNLKGTDYDYFVGTDRHRR